MCLTLVANCLEIGHKITPKLYYQICSCREIIPYSCSRCNGPLVSSCHSKKGMITFICLSCKKRQRIHQSEILPKTILERGLRH